MTNELVIAKYIRLSDEDYEVDHGVKEESVSVSSQRQLITHYIDNHTEFKGMQIVEFVDDGYSGANFDRPSFQEMMEEAKKGRISVIITKDLSRLGRDHLGVGNYLERIFPVLQIRYIAINDGYDSNNLNGMTGGMSVALHNIVNAMYCRDLSTKVKTAQMTRVKEGKYLGSIPVFGYMKDPNDKYHLIVDEEAADIVRMIFELVASGKPHNEIIAKLNSEKIITPAVYMDIHGIKKAPVTHSDLPLWTNEMVHKIIRNEHYIGNIVWNKTGRKEVGGKVQIRNNDSEVIRVEGTHEPIVSKQLFEKANKAIDKNRRNCRKYGHTGGSSPLFFCAYCKRALRRMESGNYICSQRIKSGISECSDLACNGEKLEGTVMHMINQMMEIAVKKKEKAESSGDMETSESVLAQIEALNKEQCKIKSDKMRLYTDYRSGRIAKDGYMARYECLVKRQSEIEEEVLRLNNKREKLQKEHSEDQEKQKSLMKVAGLTSFDKKLVKTVIDKVIVYSEDRIEVIWGFEDFNQKQA